MQRAEKAAGGMVKELLKAQSQGRNRHEEMERQQDAREESREKRELESDQQFIDAAANMMSMMSQFIGAVMCNTGFPPLNNVPFMSSYMAPTFVMATSNPTATTHPLPLLMSYPPNVPPKPPTIQVSTPTASVHPLAHLALKPNKMKSVVIMRISTNTNIAANRFLLPCLYLNFFHCNNIT